MRDDDRTYPQIAESLNKAGLRPKNAVLHNADSVHAAAQCRVHDRTTAQGMALFLGEQGAPLREIGAAGGVGFHPPQGGQWYAQTVKLLLTVGDRGGLQRS